MLMLSCLWACSVKLLAADAKDLGALLKHLFDSKVGCLLGCT